MTAEKIALYGGVALSLAISYLPGFKGWFEKLDPLYKRLVLISFLLVIAVGAFVLGCYGKIEGIICSFDGAYDLGVLFVLSLIASQGTYNVTKRTSRG